MLIFQKIRQFASQHKIATAFFVLVVILGLYFGYQKLSGSSAEIRYALAVVQQGTIITSVSGSGQVSVSNQVDVKPKVSGDVIYVGVKNGQEVKAWALLAQLDTADARKVVRDAEIALESAQLQLEKLKLNQSRDLTSLENDIENAGDAITSSREDGFNKVSDAFLDLPDILSGIRGILYDSTVGASNQVNTGAYQDLMDRYDLMKLAVMINQATSDYLASAEKYDKNLDDYKNATRYSPADQITSLIDETLETVRTMAQAVKDEQNLLDAVVSSLKQYQQKRQIPQAIAQYQSDISGYIGKLNGFISGLLSIQNTIKNNGQKLEDAQQSLDIAKKFNPFDVISQENTVRQKEAVLADAREDLSNCYIRAPFAGIVANINAERGDSVSGSTVVATVITKQQIAEITLNEVDVAKVKTGQKATLTFDAAPDLSVAGELSEIDTLGTVSQGVVSYAVKIAFGPVKSLASNGVNTQNEQIKPGMSVSADVITNVKQNVLLVPNSAVKSAGGTSYVEVPQNVTAASQLLANVANSAAGIILNPAPLQQAVEIGLFNDSYTEVTSGLKAGDLVITRTITPSSTTTQTQSTQTRSIFGGSSGGSTRNVMPLH